MRVSRLSAITFLLAALVAPQTLNAGGNHVLVPNGYRGGTMSAPNLGISPSTPDQNKSSAPLPKKKKDASTNQEASSDSTGTRNALTATPKKPNKQNFGRANIIHLSDTSKFIDPTALKLPKKLTISFSEKSTADKRDLFFIKKKLGLLAEEVADACYLGPFGYLMTTEDRYRLGRGLNNEPAVYYAGDIRGLSLRTQAYCRVKGKIPRTILPLVEIEDRFVLPLQAVNCKPPANGEVSELIITYRGSKQKAECVYQ